MRRLWAAGSLTITVLALALVPAGASAAGGIRAKVDQTTLWTESASSEFQFPNGDKATCQGPEMAAVISGVSTNTAMSTSGWNCSSIYSGSFEPSMSGCQFQLRAGTENEIDIGPPGCGPVTKIVGKGCAVSIVPQVGIPATFTDELSGGHKQIDIKVSAPLKYSSSCMTGTLQFNGHWTLIGVDQFGKYTDIEQTNGGFFIAGSPPKFQAEANPVPLKGVLDSGATFQIKLTHFEVNCIVGAFASTLTESSTVLPVSVSLSGCKESSGKAATVNMNGCKIQYSIANGGPPYTAGNVAINGCEKVQISIDNGSTCVIDISPIQFFVPKPNSISYAIEGAGPARRVHFGGALEGLEYQYVGGICQFLGKNQTGGSISAGFSLGA